jgi:hypothetical protein
MLHLLARTQRKLVARGSVKEPDRIADSAFERQARRLRNLVGAARTCCMRQLLFREPQLVQALAETRPIEARLICIEEPLQVVRAVEVEQLRWGLARVISKRKLAPRACSN